MTNISQISDEVLIRRIQNKDKELYAQIIKRYQAKLVRYVVYIINNEDKAKDIVQDAFIKAYVNINSFDLKKKFSSWIYRITHNEAINMLSKQKKQQPLDIKADFDSGIDIEDDVIKKELVKHTHSCLRKMSVIYREPLSLYFLEEKSYEEISDILRVPIGTVGTRINRAKKLMKKICQKNTK